MRKTSRMAHWLTALLLLSAAAAADAQPPRKAYSVIVGGISADTGVQIAVDGAGQTWVVGETYSHDFPFTAGPIEDFSNFFHDIFVARLSPAGALLGAVAIGGKSNDSPSFMDMDAAGNLYVVGKTSSPDFPATARLGPPGTTSGIFVLKLDPNGDLAYSTVIGGMPYLTVTDLAVDSEGQAHVVGYMHEDMFIAKLSADGSRFIYSRQLGGSNIDRARGVALDSAGNAHVAGVTTSSDFPQARRLPENGAAGFSEAVVVKLSPDGSRLIYSTLLGGGGGDGAQSIAIDPAGNALVYGETTSADLPVRNALQSQPNPNIDWLADAFLARLDPAGALLASTYLGGSGEELPIQLTVDPEGLIYLLGSTSSHDFPLRAPVPAYQTPFDPFGEFFYVGHLTQLDPQASEVLFSTFLDGTAVTMGWPFGMAVDAAKNVYVTGGTIDGDFTIIGPSQRTEVDRENGDAFVIKIDLGRAPDCSAATATPTAIWPPDGRMVSVALGGITDPDGDLVRVAVTSVFQDEPLSKKGQPDATGFGTAEPRVRASRVGSGDGRVYHLTFTGTDSRGASCTGAVTVCVPHDQGKRSTCGDGGPLVDSDPAEIWTAWLDRDNPSGTGDWETVAEFRADGTDICYGATPIGIECQTLGGVDWTNTGQTYACIAATGGVCRNSQQQDCQDYRVRFRCS